MMRWLAAAWLALMLVFATSARADGDYAGPSMSEPHHVAAGRVTVTCEPGLEATAHQLQAGAEDALDEIAQDLVDVPTPREIRVQLVRDASSLATIAPSRGAPAWAVGIAYPDLGLIGVAMRRGPEVLDPMATLRHELAHVALGAAIGDRAPHWLHEGFAYQHSADASMERAETLAGMAWLGGIIPIQDLDHSFPAEESPANRAYAESYDFVGYLARRGRWEDGAPDRWAFRMFLTDVGHGAALDVAARHRFGKPIADLFDEWKSDLRTRYFMAPVGLLGLAVWLACAILLGLAWRRRRRLNKLRIAQWERDERAADRAAPRLRPIIVPPYVPWPGEDPFADKDDLDDDERGEPGPDLVN